jgi:hypothetical protein
MKYNYIKVLYSVFMLTVFYFSPNQSSAQLHLGMQNSNYAGTNGIYTNPSSIAGSGYLMHMNFLSRGVDFSNNYLQYNAPFKLNQWANKTYPPQYQTFASKMDYEQSWLTELPLNGDLKNFHFDQDIHFLAFMFPISKRHYVSLNTRQRNMIQARGIDEPMARFARFGFDGNRGDIFNGDGSVMYNNPYTSGKFSVNIESWQEYSLTVAGRWVDNKRWLVTGGATLKYLRGMGSAYLRSDGLTYEVNNADSLTLSNGQFEYGHTSQNDVFYAINNPGNLASHPTTGGGIGLDMGLTIMKKSDKPGRVVGNFWDFGCKNSNRPYYDWKLGFALMDAGYISHGRGVRTYRTTMTEPTGLKPDADIFDDFYTGGDGFDKVDNDLFGQLPHELKNSYVSYLPMAANIQADFRVTRAGYVGFNWQHGLKSASARGVNAMNFVSVIPRVESFLGEFALPITLTENYKTVNMGLYARFWFFFFGTDNLPGLLNVSSNSATRAASIYAGFSAGIGHCRYRGTEATWVEDRYIHDTVPVVDSLLVEDLDTLYDEEPIDSFEATKPDTFEKVLNDTIYIEKTDTVVVEVEKVIDCKDCESKLAALKRENEALRKERDTEKNRNRNLEREIATMRNKTKALEADLSNCKNTNTEENKPTGVTTAEWEKRIAQARLEEQVKCKEELDKLNLHIVQITNDKKKLENDFINLKNERDLCLQQKDGVMQEYQFCTNKLTELEKELKECRESEKAETSDEEVMKLNLRIDALEKEKKELETLRKTCDDKLKALEAQKIILENEKSKCESDLKLAEAEVVAVKKEVENQKIIIAKLENDLKDCKENTASSEEIKKLNEQLKSKDQTIKQLQDSVTLYRNEYHFQKNQNYGIMQEYLNCQEQLNKLKLELENLKKENSNSDNSEQIKKLESEIANLNSEKKALETQLSNCKANETDCFEKLKAAETKLKNCEEENSKLKSQSNQSSDETEKIKALEDELKTVKIQLSNVEKDKKQLQDSFTLYRNEYLFQKNQNYGIMQEYLNCQEQLDKLKIELEKLKKENSNDNSEQIKKLENDITKLNAEKKELEDKLQASQSSLLNCENKLKECEIKTDQSSNIFELERKQKSLQSEIDKLKSDLAYANSKEKQLQLQLNESQKSTGSERNSTGTSSRTRTSGQSSTQVSTRTGESSEGGSKEQSTTTRRR